MSLILVLLVGMPAFAENVDEAEDEAVVPGTGQDALSELIQNQEENVQWHWPLYGRVTSQFGWRRDPKGRGRKMHAGIDIAAAPGRTVRAAGRGLVRFAGRAAAYGLMVEIQHPDGHRTRYAHMNALFVKRGAKVDGGDPIGAVGNTGRSTGPHLHFELREGRKPVDPAVIAINFAQAVDAEADQKGPVMRVPGMPHDPVAQSTQALYARMRGVLTMVWDWWSA